MFAFVHQVLHEPPVVLIVVENVDSVLVLGEDETKMLVRVGQDVQNEWRTVFQVHPRVLTELHNLEVQQYSLMRESTHKLSKDNEKVGVSILPNIFRVYVDLDSKIATWSFVMLVFIKLVSPFDRDRQEFNIFNIKKSRL